MSEPVSSSENKETGKTHPKGSCTAPLCVKAAEAQPGPEVQVGVILVQGSALGRDEAALGLWGSTSHSHHSPQELKGFVEGSICRIQQHRGERIWGRGWCKGCFLGSRGSWGDF